MKARAFWVLLAICFVRCGEDRTPVACATYAAAGLGVSVANATTGQPICDAVVIASEGSYSEQLFGNACTFSGAYERPGTYAVRATRQGFRPKEIDSVRVVMGGGECPHVEQARVTVALTPEG
jgi:hypothetical protein